MTTLPDRIPAAARAWTDARSASGTCSAKSTVSWPPVRARRVRRVGSRRCGRGDRRRAQRGRRVADRLPVAHSRWPSSSNGSNHWGHDPGAGPVDTVMWRLRSRGCTEGVATRRGSSGLHPTSPLQPNATLQLNLLHCSIWAIHDLSTCASAGRSRRPIPSGVKATDREESDVG